MDIFVLFFTHFGALQFEKKHEQNFQGFTIEPTPRKLSSSCGVCAHFQSTEIFDVNELINDHVAGIYKKTGNEYQCLYDAD